MNELRKVKTQTPSVTKIKNKVLVTTGYVTIILGCYLIYLGKKDGYVLFEISEDVIDADFEIFED